MTENINILLSDSTTEEEKINSANNIITDYNLNLTSEEITLIFTKARSEKSTTSYYIHTFIDYGILFEYLLNQNIDMFIAMIKSWKDFEKTKIYWLLSMCISSHAPFYVGSNDMFGHDLTISTYIIFLNYNNFNIDNLTMPDECREKIQEYRNEKYGGELTKSAKK